MNEPLIVTRHLTKNYHLDGFPVHALRGISVEIGAGDFVAIMGPSGSGKSTFMNLLGCLDSPSSGEYLLAGEPVSALSGNALAAIRNRRLGCMWRQHRHRQTRRHDRFAFGAPNIARLDERRRGHPVEHAIAGRPRGLQVAIRPTRFG